MDLGPVEVDDPADLAEVVLGVDLDLFARQLGAGLVASGGVAHQGRVVADDDDRRVTQLLELPEFAERDRVAEVDVDPGRVDAVLDPQGGPLARRALELLEELVVGDDRLDAASQDFKLFGNIPHRTGSLPRALPSPRDRAPVADATTRRRANDDSRTAPGFGQGGRAYRSVGG